MKLHMDITIEVYFLLFGECVRGVTHQIALVHCLCMVHGACACLTGGYFWITQELGQDCQDFDDHAPPTELHNDSSESYR